MQQDAKGMGANQAEASNDELTRKFDQITLKLIGGDVFFTILFILAELISLQSSFQSVELINRKYREPRPDDQPLSPATTALIGTMFGAISTVGLVWVASDRLNQQITKRQMGFDTVSIWPQALIVITGLVIIIMSVLRVLAVKDKQQEEAQVVIL